MTARMASAVDDLSGGRLTLGLGAGWQEREHAHYGWELLNLPERFARFEEGLEVITRLLKRDEPLDFEGRYYQLKEAVLLPRPARPGGPPICIGGNGPRRTLPLVVRFADEWNANFITANQFAKLNTALNELLSAAGRPASAVRRSLMTGCYFGRDDSAVSRKIASRNRTAAELRERGLIVGTAGALVEQLGQLANAGVQRVLLQWLDLDDLDGLEAMAETVLPQLQR